MMTKAVNEILSWSADDDKQAYQLLICPNAQTQALAVIRLEWEELSRPVTRVVCLYYGKH